MTDGLRKSHLRKAPQVGLSEVGVPEGNRRHGPPSAIYNLGLGKYIHNLHTIPTVYTQTTTHNV